VLNLIAEHLRLCMCLLEGLAAKAHTRGQAGAEGEGRGLMDSLVLLSQFPTLCHLTVGCRGVLTEEYLPV